MGAVSENTEELQVGDLSSTKPPPVPRQTGPVDAVADTVAGEPIPLRSPPRPLRRSPRASYRRLLRAYLATTKVVLSYMWLTFARRFRSEEALQQLIQDTHRRNARRAMAAIVQLQGLFIKVGQLISIMANFLPEAFRQELQGLQDQVPPRPYKDIEARLREELG